jgi:hypothetical protein
MADGLWCNRICIRYALSMSTKDQLLYSALHGTAMRYAAERRNLDESIEELRQIADGRNDILAEAAGITAGSCGLPMDYDELERWTRIGFDCRAVRCRGRVPGDSALARIAEAVGGR